MMETSPMFTPLLCGKVWLFGSNVDTDQILPGYAMLENPESLGRFAMAGSKRQDFASLLAYGDCIVAGENFGCGSSREQAPVSLYQVGVRLVVARSFAKIFKRNAINIGLPVLETALDEHVEHVQDGDIFCVYLETVLITINEQMQIQAKPLSNHALEILKAGGLINRVRQQLGIDKKMFHQNN